MSDSPGSLARGFVLRAILGLGGAVGWVALGFYMGQSLAGFAGALAWTAHVAAMNRRLDEERLKKGLTPFEEAFTGEPAHD